MRAFLAGPDEATTHGAHDLPVRRRARSCAIARCCTRWRSATAPLLEKGRYPLAALFLDVPGAERGRQRPPAEAGGALRARAGGLRGRAPRGGRRRSRARPGCDGRGAPRGAHADAARQPPALPRAGVARAAGRARRRRGAAARAWSCDARRRRAALPLRGARRPSAARRGPACRRGAAPAGRGRARAAPFFAGLTYIGQLHRTYLVCESARRADPGRSARGARARRLRAAARGARAAAQMPRQRLLFPLPIEVDEAAAAVAEAGTRGAGRAGLRGRARAARARVLPARRPRAAQGRRPQAAAARRAGRAGRRDAARRRRSGAASITCWPRWPATASCARATCSGAREALALLAQLDDVDLRSHCPHGRPVLLRMPLGEIERRFGRA